MPASTAWIFCSCGHLAAEHNGGGQCRARTESDWPCNCQQLDADDQD
jgi:hypothetical protein